MLYSYWLSILYIVVCILYIVVCILEKAMAPHSSALAGKIPWTEEPGRLWSMGSLRVTHDWATSLSLFTFMHWRRKWQPTPVFLPGESQGRGSLMGWCLWVAQSRTRLKSLNSSVYMSVSISLFLSLFHYPLPYTLVAVNLFSTSVILLLFCK